MANGSSALGGKSMMISIVTPVYNEEASLAQFHRTVQETLFTESDVQFEVIFVDDGSTDESWTMIESICNEDERFRGLRLSRNFGSHSALTAGILAARGAAVSTLASDLQDPPKTILEFIEKWRAGAEIVWGRRRKRDDKGWRVIASNMFYRLIRRFAMPRGSQFATGSFFLIDRRVVECFRQFPERNRITFALVAWTGFRQDTVLYDRESRIAGSTGWTFGRMLKSMYDTFIGFSDLPARLMTILGAVTFLPGLELVADGHTPWMDGTDARLVGVFRLAIPDDGPGRGVSVSNLHRGRGQAFVFRQQ